MPTILQTPQSLHRLAMQATGENRDVTLDPGQIRQIADSWWDDRQKIKYLESLIVRMGRPAESVVTLSCKIDCSDIEAILNTLPKNPAI
ncbi:hypothetical protein PQR71_40080 [Paraburkholderia fungorum]|uniref:hypothetical protein n=1 Tax=Paraburkholderia fungorum TaxID=134537 RepID=UPI0038BDB082